MSVICFDRDEIIQALASAWHHGSIGSTDGLRKLDQYADLGNAIMTANAAAYTATYQEAVNQQPAITGLEVKRKLISITVESQRRGVRKLRMIRYNLIANDGQDFATAEILDGLLWFMGCLLDRSELLRGAA